MTSGERDAFRIAVNQCWNVDAGSEAARATVDIGFSMTPDGKVVSHSIKLVSSRGDAPEASVKIAFEAGRRAILRCQGDGYELPADKYEQWKEVIITFDPSGMRMR